MPAAIATALARGRLLRRPVPLLSLGQHAHRPRGGIFRMGNPKKLPQVKRGLGRHGLKKDDPIAIRRRQAGKTPKKNSLHGRVRSREELPLITASKPRLPEAEARRVRRIELKSRSKTPAAARIARSTSEAERMATARKTRYSVGIASGGMVGDKPKRGSRRTPSRGRHGVATSRTRR
jgi:hypothetical protein